ncbi:MAG TPA: hypothetical protein VLB27_02670 [candidate division Zixibacteria bacterium]|nr:hypothetical protein [candidate division Zixibacteria bacterium]
MTTTRLSRLTLALLATLSLGLTAAAQSGGDSTEAFVPDPEGARDTLYTEITRIGPNDWSINVSYFTDVEVFAASVPLKFTAGLRRVVVDSTIFTGGAAEHFQVKTARPDTAIQCVTIGLIAALSPNGKPLAPGKGRLGTVFLHAQGDGAAPALVVDTTTTHPENSLMFVKQNWTTNKQTKIYPAYVPTSSEKAKK